MQGLGSIYLFKNCDDVQYFDKYERGYEPVREGHQSEIGARECEGFYAKSFNTYNKLEYEQDRLNVQHNTFIYVCTKYKYDGLFQRNGSANRRGHLATEEEPNTGYLMARYRIYGKEITFINLNLHSVPFEDVGELIEQVTLILFLANLTIQSAGYFDNSVIMQI